MKREYGLTELVRQEDGAYRIGTLDEYLVFGGTGSRTFFRPAPYRLKSADAPGKDCNIHAGSYFQDETLCRLTVTEEGGSYQISHPRYGNRAAVLHRRPGGIFGFGPDFVMYVTACEDGIELNGYRARHMICRSV